MKTIGVAVTDAMGWIARGVTTIRRFSWKADLAALETILDEFKIKVVVIGLPLGREGEITEQARFSQGAGNKIKETFPDLTIEYVDESFSSQQAEELMKAQNLNVKERKARIDEFAAILILQSFVDEQARLEKAKVAKG